MQALKHSENELSILLVKTNSIICYGNLAKSITVRGQISALFYTVRILCLDINDGMYIFAMLFECVTDKILKQLMYLKRISINDG